MATDRTKRPRQGVQVITRAIEILRALETSEGGLSLAQISAKVGLPRSTVHRLIQALAEEGFVVAAGKSGGFRLGPELARIAAASREDLLVIVRPHLEELGRRVEETVDLAVLEGTNVRFIEHIPPVPTRQTLVAVAAVGARVPTHSTAPGKALLAALSLEDLERALPRKLTRETSNTITRRPDLLAELERVRAEGLAYVREEHTAGISAVAALISDAFDNRAAISIPVPARRFHEHEAELSSELRATARKINQLLSPRPAVAERAASAS